MLFLDFFVLTFNAVHVRDCLYVREGNSANEIADREAILKPSSLEATVL